MIDRNSLYSWNAIKVRMSQRCVEVVRRSGFSSSLTYGYQGLSGIVMKPSTCTTVTMTHNITMPRTEAKWMETDQRFNLYVSTFDLRKWPRTCRLTQWDFLLLLFYLDIDFILFYLFIYLFIFYYFFLGGGLKTKKQTCIEILKISTTFVQIKAAAFKNSKPLIRPRWQRSKPQTIPTYSMTSKVQVQQRFCNMNGKMSASVPEDLRFLFQAGSPGGKALVPVSWQMGM